MLALVLESPGRISMTSSKLLAVGTIISILLVVWWFASGLARRLERLEQTLSVVQVTQQQLQRHSNTGNLRRTCAPVLTALKHSS